MQLDNNSQLCLGKGQSISVVMVTRNRVAMLKHSLGSVLKQTIFNGIVKNIILVDNASTDETPQVLDSLSIKYPRIHVIHLKENIGGAGGFAVGIHEATKHQADWIFVMDDDVALMPTALECLLKYACPNRVLGCLRLNESGIVVERASRRYDLASPFVLNPRRDALYELYGHAEEMRALESVEFISFEGMLFPSSLIARIGLPRSEFFIFGDDCDFSIRSRMAGMEMYIVRDAQLTRLINYDRENLFKSWKTKYIVRNFFVLHFLYGENFLVRWKPFALTAVLVLGCLLAKLTGHPKMLSGRFGFSPLDSLEKARKLTHDLKLSTHHNTIHNAL